jgi:hypothetical protein
MVEYENIGNNHAITENNASLYVGFINSYSPRRFSPIVDVIRKNINATMDPRIRKKRVNITEKREPLENKAIKLPYFRENLYSLYAFV